MIKVKVNTIFQGQVAIRDKYLKQAEATGQDILITHDKDQMLIRFTEVHKYKARSLHPVKDRYSKEKHLLVYYDWEPTSVQVRF